MSRPDHLRPVELLEEDQPGKFVGQGEIGKSPDFVSPVKQFGAMTIGSADQEAEPRHRLCLGEADNLRQILGPELFAAFVKCDDPPIGLFEEAGGFGSLPPITIAVLAVFDLEDLDAGDPLQPVQIEGTAFLIEAALELADCDDPISHGRQATAAAGSGERQLEVAALRLVALYCLEQRLEVSNPEPARTVTLDHFIKNGGSVLHRFGEDLQQISLVVLIHQHP